MPSRSRLALLVLYLLVRAPSFAQSLIDGIAVDPFEVHSPSAACTLAVDPSSPLGIGPATYRLQRGASVAWSKELPWTLAGIELGDDGTFAGWRVDPEKGARCVLVGADGNVRFDVPLSDETSSSSANNDPVARGIVLATDQDRALFRIRSTRADGLDEEWRAVKISSGEALPSVRPPLPAPPDQATCLLGTVKAIRGAPLLACGWVVLTGPESPRGAAAGAYFCVTDYEGKVVLGLDLAHDYEAGGDAQLSERLQKWAYFKNESIRCDAPRSMTLVVAGQSIAATFELFEDANAPTGWSARNSPPQPFKIELDAPQPPPPALTPTQPLALALVSATPLKLPPSPQSSFTSFEIDDRGRVAQIDNPRFEGPEFQLFGPDGASLATCPLEWRRSDVTAPQGPCWLGGDRWLVCANTNAQPAHGLAYWFDLSSRALTPIASYDGALLYRACGAASGEFAVLARASVADSQVVAALYDARGTKLWSAPITSCAKGAPPAAAMDVCVRPGGEVDVLNGSCFQILRFDRAGQALATVDLTSWCGPESFPTTLDDFSDGGWMLELIGAEPGFVRVSREGTWLNQIEPKFSDGHALNVTGSLRVAPDDRVWATDGTALVRVDGLGKADRVFGDAPSTDALGPEAFSSLDSTGRVSIGDLRSGVVHVFGTNGERSGAYRLPPEATRSGTLWMKSTIAPDGGVYVCGSDPAGTCAVHVDASGASSACDRGVNDVLFPPTSHAHWTLRTHEIDLVAAGGAVKRKLARTSDGKWLGLVRFADVAPDGTLAVVSRGKLHTFALDGTPRASLDLPHLIDRPSVGSNEFACFAFDGAHAFFGLGVNLWSWELASGVLRKAVLQDTSGNTYAHQIAWDPTRSELCVYDSVAHVVKRFRFEGLR